MKILSVWIFFIFSIFLGGYAQDTKEKTSPSETKKTVRVDKREIKTPSYREYKLLVSPFYSFEEEEKNQPLKIIEITDAYFRKYNEALCDYDKIKILKSAGSNLANTPFKDKMDKKKGLEYIKRAVEISPGLFSSDKISAMSYVIRLEFTDSLDLLKRLISFRYCLNFLNSLSDDDLKVYLVYPFEMDLGVEDYPKSFREDVKFQLQDNISWLSNFDSIKDTPEFEKLMMTHFGAGIKWFADKNQIKFDESSKSNLKNDKNSKSTTQPIVIKEPIITPKSNYFLLDKLRNKELTKENIEVVANYLENEEHLDPKDFGGELSNWMKETRICDYAYSALEQMVCGNGYEWNRLKYSLKTKDKKLEEWRAWWKTSKELPLIDIGRNAIEKSLIKPISKENKIDIGNAIYVWAGWAFDARNRILYNDEKPEDILIEIKAWWESQKDKDIASWKRSLADLKISPKYEEIRKASTANQKIKIEAFSSKRKAEMEKLQKESPEVIEFLKNGDKFERDFAGITKTLEKIKTIKPKLIGTTLEEEILEFEQRLMADPILEQK